MNTDNMAKTRAEAIAKGDSHYFTGKPCKHGHMAPRKIKGSCVECLKVEWEKSYQTRAEYFRNYNDSAAGKKARREYYERNKQTVIEKSMARDKVVVAEYKKKHKENNPDYYRSLVSLRRRRFRQATPKWLSAEEKMEIRFKYRLAIELSRRTGKKHVVDHVVPLQGKDVCGLHVPWNMQVITQEENLQKSNKHVDSI